MRLSPFLAWHAGKDGIDFRQAVHATIEFCLLESIEEPNAGFVVNMVAVKSRD